MTIPVRGLVIVALVAVLVEAWILWNRPMDIRFTNCPIPVRSEKS